MPLAREDVAKIARLARIAMTDAELDRFSEQLTRIVAYIDKLNALDTADVEPLAHALPVANILRDDEPHESLPQAVVIREAPERTETSFKVPRVIDEGASA